MTMIIRGQVTPPTKLPALIATDGSAWYARRSKTWFTGWGWLSTDGSYQLGAAPVPVELMGSDAPGVTELRAVWHAVRERVPARSAMLLLDSDDAGRHLTAWAGGNLVMPNGYIGSLSGVPTLKQLAMFVELHHPLMAWAIVKGHSGHLLNEAADSLAKIGREWCRREYSRAQAEERAHRLVEGFLADDRLAEVA